MPSDGILLSDIIIVVVTLHSSTTDNIYASDILMTISVILLSLLSYHGRLKMTVVSDRAVALVVL